MKVRTALRRMCATCKIVRRGRKVFVICPSDARHKQRQGFSTLALPQAATEGFQAVVAGDVYLATDCISSSDLVPLR